ncbi:hypothetical protein RvY_15111-2 [Ramazzottius varieornatus]|nr:hypothetical protein RvY_15111-2 [Ramazzottius varieornatus]
MLEGSPKRYTPFTDSPVNGTLVNGIRFRLSPSSPSCSSGAVSPLANIRNPSVSLASSENSENSKPSSLHTRAGLNNELTGHRSIRRISSGLFETELSSNTAVTFMVPLAQLAFNLSVYIEAGSSHSHSYRLPEPFTDERHAIPSEGSIIIDSALRDGIEQGVDDDDEKAEIMVGIEASTRRKSSAPILIKSRSVEAAMNSRKPQKASADQLSFCVMPRDVRKNALQSSHLIERQGSAPQLMLKRKPKGLDDDGSLGSSPMGSPVTGLSRCGTRQQILTNASSLKHSGLTHYMQD